MQDSDSIPLLNLTSLPHGQRSPSGCSTGSLREVVVSRLNAVVAETEARRDWLRHIGIQGPLQFAWVLSKAQQVTGHHWDALNRSGLASLWQDGNAGPQLEVPMLETDATPSLTRPSSESSARLLYRSFHYSWINYEFILFMSEEWISPPNAAVLQRLSGEACQLLENLESFDPRLAETGGEEHMAEPHSGGRAKQRVSASNRARIAIEFPSGRPLKLHLRR